MLGVGFPTHFKNNITHVVPSDIANLGIWLKNNTLVGTAGWEDSSGNNRDISQSEAGYRGTLDLGGLRLDGTDNFYSWASSYLDMGGTQDFTLFVVLKRNGGASDDNTIIGGDTHDQKIYIANEETIYYCTDNNDAGGGAPPSGQAGVNSKFVFPTDTWTDAKVIMTISKTNVGGFTWRKNGVTVSGVETGASNTINIGQNLKIKHLGALDDGTDTTNDKHMNGSFYELIYYTSKLTDTQIYDINNYLRNKFAI